MQQVLDYIERRDIRDQKERMFLLQNIVSLTQTACRNAVQPVGKNCEEIKLAINK